MIRVYTQPSPLQPLCPPRVPTEVFAWEIIILDKRRVHAHAIHIIPLLIFSKRRYPRSHRALHTLYPIRRRRQTSVEQPNHIIARLTVRKRDLVGDILEEGQWERRVGRAGEQGIDARGAVPRALGTEVHCAAVFMGFRWSVGVAGGVEDGGEDVGAVV
jgi:hypothetical protein